MRRTIAFAAMLSAVALSVSIASAATSGKFCLKESGMKDNCTFKTMAACEKAKKGTGSCEANTTSPMKK
jgi:Protein of unknown function (DUF3551)